jgi:cyclic pyranopterin phosphate synthase
MPFSGEKMEDRRIDYGLAERLAGLFPALDPIQTDNGTTAKEFKVPGFKGSLGIIEGSSRKFCSTCNRVRITPQGMLKVCLYDNGVLDLKELIRTGMDDKELLKQIRSCLNKRFADGHQTESVNGRAAQPSMASIGG